MIITVYENMPYDLSAFNVTVTDGSLGHILGCYAQEIDIATGKYRLRSLPMRPESGKWNLLADLPLGQALFTWASLDHVKPDMSYAASGNTGGDVSIPWDYFVRSTLVISYHQSELTLTASTSTPLRRMIKATS